MNNLIDVMKFEQALVVGDSVVVRWTHCNGYYEAPGTVAKLNDKSIRVALTDNVSSHTGGWPKGFEIRVPRCKMSSMKLWSWNNGTFPVTSARA